MVSQLLVNGLINGALFSLVSIGFALSYNTTKIFHIAYAGMYLMGAYLVYTFHNQVGCPLVISVFLATILTGLMSVMIELFVYRPLEEKKASRNVILISSLGILIVIINFIAIIFGNEPKLIRTPDNTSIFMSPQFSITTAQVVSLLGSMGAILLVMITLRYSKLGLLFRAFRDNPILYEVLGANKNKLRVIIFFISGVIASIAGFLSSYDVGMDPNIGLPMLITGVVAMIIGGIGNFAAPILGGFLLGISQALVIWQFSSVWDEVVTFTLLIFYLILRPRGILGEKNRTA